MTTSEVGEVKPACEKARKILEGASRVNLDDMTPEIKAAVTHVSTCADCIKVVEY